MKAVQQIPRPVCHSENLENINPLLRTKHLSQKTTKKNSAKTEFFFKIFNEISFSFRIFC